MRVTKMEYRGFPEIEFDDLNSYDDFDKILMALSRNFSFQYARLTNGPESRICELGLKGYQFLLVNNPYGNSIRCMEEDPSTGLY
jgi:hypothetical protein